jgi:hypothetical protein
MKYGRLGQTGLWVSRLAFGNMTFGSNPKLRLLVYGDDGGSGASEGGHRAGGLMTKGGGTIHEGHEDTKANSEYRADCRRGAWGFISF